MNSNTNNVKVFNLYNATQHVIFSISFLENVLNSITDDRGIDAYRSLISSLKYLAEKICDLLELEVGDNSGEPYDSSNQETTAVDDSYESISEEVRDYIRQIKEEIERERNSC